MESLVLKEDIVQMVKVLYPQLKNVSDVEVLKAISVAKKIGLDPLKKEVHFIPFGNQVQVVVNYLEYVKRAKEKLDGYATTIGKDDIGMYAECTIYRKDWSHPFIWRVYLKEAQKDTKAWKEMPLFMLRKVAIAQAFRLCFPEEIQELPYTEEEIIEENIEITNNEEKVISEKQRKRLFAIARENGISNEEVKRIISELGYESTKDIKVKDYDKIIELLQLFKPSETIETEE
jgi:hypothetical protein